MAGEEVMLFHIVIGTSVWICSGEKVLISLKSVAEDEKLLDI